MLYAWIGFLKSGQIPESVQVQTSDFLSQPLMTIHSAGQLRDSSGNRTAMMMIFEDESREAAERFVATSPYLQADLYEQHCLYEYDQEVG
jgi:uncharacterized protein YciI